MRRILIILLASILALPLQARITLPSLFSDGMVLQRQSTVRIWGNSDGESRVSVSTSWNGKLYTCKPAPNGNWSVSVSTPATGGPFIITIDDGERLEIKDVHIGEVWICCGQSNMEMTVKGFPTQPVEGAADIILNSSDYDVHAFTVGRALSETPSSSCTGKWTNCDISTVADVSAVAYLFGRRIAKTLGVPVGIIVSAWGGSSILGWTPEAVIDRSLSAQEKSEILSYCNTSKDKSGVLFNGMIAPIAGYAAKGFIWYQGEANVNTPGSYGKVLKAMISCWRDSWGDRKGQMPFYAVEIAPSHCRGYGKSPFHGRECRLDSHGRYRRCRCNPSHQKEGSR